MVLQRLGDAVTYMIGHARTQRDRVILMLLNYTGARLSEILGLTAGGYRKAKHACRAKVTDKGSCGREEKTIYFTPAIERALIQYIRTERARHDPRGRKRIDQLADNEPLFLTRRGTCLPKIAPVTSKERVAVMPPCARAWNVSSIATNYPVVSWNHWPTLRCAPRPSFACH